jgi:hypothetical protein
MRTAIQAAAALKQYFAAGIEAEGLFTDPYYAWHCYDRLDKKARPNSLKPGDGDPGKNIVTALFAGYRRVEALAAEKSVTCLLETEVRRADGTTFLLPCCMVHFLNDQGQVYRVEAYYDPRELERDAWYRQHMLPYEGMPGS